MSIRLGITTITTIATTLLFWPVPSVRAEETVAPLVTVAPPERTAPTKPACLLRRAPIGHRQPRPSEISGPVRASPADDELRRIDADINRKLIICRGC